MEVSDFVCGRMNVCVRKTVDVRNCEGQKNMFNLNAGAGMQVWPQIFSY